MNNIQHTHQHAVAVEASDKDDDGGGGVPAELAAAANCVDGGGGGILFWRAVLRDAISPVAVVRFWNMDTACPDGAYLSHKRMCLCMTGLFVCTLYYTTCVHISDV